MSARWDRLQRGARRSLAATILLTSVLFEAGTAETRIARTLASCVRDADVVASGVIARLTTRCPDEFPAPTPGPFTDYTFIVSTVWKGCALPGDSMTVRTLGGGLCNGEELEVEGVPRFSAGDSLVLFLTSDPRHLKLPIWRYSWQLYPGHASLKDGEARMPEASDLPYPLPSDQLEHRVRQAVTQQAGWARADSGLKGSITGAVGDSAGRVAQARVTVGAGRPVACDAHGAFQLLNLPAGCVRLLFEAAGHRAEAKVLRVWPAWTETLRVVLQPAGPGGH